MGYEERARAPTEPPAWALGPPVASRLTTSISGGDLDCHADNLALWNTNGLGAWLPPKGVEFDTVMENRFHDPIKGHERALEKLLS